MIYYYVTYAVSKIVTVYQFQPIKLQARGLPLDRPSPLQKVLAESSTEREKSRVFFERKIFV